MRDRNFRDFWYSLTEEARVDFMRDTGLSLAQIRVNYLSRNPLKRSRPTNERLALMMVASRGRMSVESLLNYFFGEAIRIHLSELQNKKSPNAENAGAHQIIQQQ